MTSSDDTTDGKSVRERVRYFQGQLLGSADLVAEQEYWLELRRLHNRVAHGWGVISGFSVEPAGGPDKTNTTVTVGPGYALSPLGEEIILEECATIDVATALETPDDRPVSLFVAVRYAERLTRPVPMPNRDGGESASEFSRIRSSYELDILDVLPQSHAQAAAAQLAWQATWKHWLAASGPGGANREPWGLPVPPCPPRPVDSWVVLAAVRLVKVDKISRIDAIDFAPRRALWPAWAIQSAVLPP
ncbi:MAG: hypothetical protein ACXWK3_22905 [Reyranella sp.]